jgi:two-component system, OmpR family, sensor kinase
MAASSASPAAPAPASARPGRGLRRSLTELSDRTPLRVKLIAALLTLVIAALAGITVAGAFIFSDYLHSNADRQVTSLLTEADQSFQYALGSRNPALNQMICLGSNMEAFYTTELPGLGPSTLQPCQNFQTSGGTQPDINVSASWLKANADKLITVKSTNGHDSWRILEHPATYTLPGGAPLTGTVIVGEDLGNINQTIARLISIDLIVGAIVVVGLAVAGIAIVRASLQPLAEIERTASEIADGDLSRRVPDGDPRTEVGSLGRSLNAMLAHIEAAFQAQARSEAAARRSEGRMRQFAADASHELRTPLTAIKGFAEYYRQRGGVGANGNGHLPHEDVDRIMQRVEEEASRMGVLVEDLLLLARIDQQRPLEHHPVDVLALAADAVQDARMIAPDRDVRLNVGHDTAFLVLGDEARLRQVVGNLMNNALSHTPAGTPVEVYVHSGTLSWQNAGTRLGSPGPVGISGPGTGQPWAPAVILEVVDHGPGMTAEQAQHVFERFYRTDQARTRATGGTGLGLAIVSALVMSHGGTVALDTAPGRGATFRVALPLDPEAAQGTDDEEDDDAPSPPPPPPPSPAPGRAQAQPAEPSRAEPGRAEPARAEPADVVEKQGWNPRS